jgi:hypothetical protein
MEPARKFALSVTKQKSREVGGCNFCGRHTAEHGEIDREVYVVRARHQGSLVARFCPSCAEEFDLMTEAAVEEQAWIDGEREFAMGLRSARV